MNWISNKFIILFTIVSTLIPSLGWSKPSAEMCRHLFALSVDKVLITHETYDKQANALRDTLAGNLATVWRSEWKTKLDILQSNSYVFDLVKNLLTDQTQVAVLTGLDITHEGFTREVHARLYELQIKKLLLPEDKLAVRDGPAPEGAIDTTFTYYTKPLSDVAGDGKHQVRVRTYLRQVKFREIPIGQSAQGFNVRGNSVSITRVDANTVKVRTSSDNVIINESMLNIDQLIAEHGTSIRLFAPHGKQFKLEIKSALDDEISGAAFPLLGGKHMVQKLDVSLSMAQVSSLFAPTNAKDKVPELMNRINNLMRELIEKKPETKARVESVFAVIIEGLRNNPDFLTLEGATMYHRTAFETKTGLQTTIDRSQGVYVGNMYTENSLKNPFVAIQSNVLIKTKSQDARHVELKVPVTSIANTAGITFVNPAAAPAPQNANYDQGIKNVLGIYHKYVKNAFHSGKFNYIRDNGEVTD